MKEGRKEARTGGAGFTERPRGLVSHGEDRGSFLEPWGAGAGFEQGKATLENSSYSQGASLSHGPP